MKVKFSIEDFNYNYEAEIELNNRNEIHTSAFNYFRETLIDFLVNKLSNIEEKSKLLYKLDEIKALLNEEK